MIEILEQDKKNFEELAEFMLNKMGDDIELLPTIYRIEQKSKLEGKLEIALNLLKKGFELAVVSEASGISEQDLTEYLNSH